MRLGLFLNTPPGWDPVVRFEAVLNMAASAQLHGFDVVVAPQHYADTGQRLLQPVPLLGRLAGEVPRIRLATGILLAGLLNPYEVAESLATIDIMSGGRAVLGTGAGHRPEELAAFGVSREDRGSRLEQCLTDVRGLWSMPVHAGKPRFTAPASLRPVQPGGIPIWVAGTSDAGVRRAARVGDAWYTGPGTTLDALERQLVVYTDELTRLGRKLPEYLPIRRDVYLASGTRQLDLLHPVLASRYAAQAASDYQGDLPRQDRLARRGLAASGTGWNQLVGREVIAGDVAQCAAQLRELAARLPVPPLVVLRIAWPDLEPAGLPEQLDALGELGAHLAAGPGEGVDAHD